MAPQRCRRIDENKRIASEVRKNVVAEGNKLSTNPLAPESSIGFGVMHPHGLHRALHPLWFTPVHAALTHALGARPGERVIDVGAGTGLLSRRLARSGAKVICLEPDAESLTTARQRLAGLDVEFLETAVERLPLPDASVDAAVASVTAHHWTDQTAGFTELARVLRPDGRFVMAEFKPAGPVLYRVRKLAHSKHLDSPGPGDWAERLRTAGFSDVRGLRAGFASILALFVQATR